MKYMTIEEAIEGLEKLIEIQRGACTGSGDKDDQYMRGMYNGLVCAKAVLDNKEPKYLDENLKISASLPNK